VKLLRKLSDGSTLLKISIIIKASGSPAPKAKAFFVSSKIQDDKKLIPLNIPKSKNIPIFNVIKDLISSNPGNEASELTIPAMQSTNNCKAMLDKKNIA
jgi:hypothetical protein